jgi:predicted nucleotidyltransferase
VPGVRAILGEQLVGLYLFGSLAVGDFDPANSDIDFVAVTEEEVTGELLARLQAFHAELFACGLPLADQLEGAYLSRAALRKYDPATARHPHTDWVVQRYSLREHGVVLFGPPIKTLIDPITPAALTAAIVELLGFWWEPMLADDTHLRHNGYHAYAVATFCRMLYTVEHGAVVSKPAAGRWAMARLDPSFSPLIQRALVYQLTPDDIPATRALLRYTLARCREAGG